MRRRCVVLRRPRAQRGAAAVELALVSLIFFPILFGIIDYGLWFNDSLNTRQGVREAARRAVVQTVSSSCGGGAVSLDNMVCDTKRQIDAISGRSYAKVLVPDGWSQGQPLVVCAVVRADGVTGVTPLPRDAFIHSKTSMSIEEALAVPAGSAASGSTSAQDADPSGDNWAWCTL